jgi:hypothetical protein
MQTSYRKGEGNRCAALASSEDQRTHSLSWLDEEELGIRVFIREEQGSAGVEVRAYVEGVRAEVMSEAVSVALVMPV